MAITFEQPINLNFWMVAQISWKKAGNQAADDEKIDARDKAGNCRKDKAKKYSNDRNVKSFFPPGSIG